MSSKHRNQLALSVHVVACGCALLTLACGRLRFDDRDDGGISVGDGHLDSAGLDAVARCAIAAPFTTIRELTELDSAGLEGGLRLSDDELTAYFHSDRGTAHQLWTASRGNITAAFGTPVLFLATDSLWPTVSADGLTLVYNTLASPDLFVSTRATPTAAFPTGSKIAALSTAGSEASPFLGATGTTLYFTRFNGASGGLQIAPWPNPTGSQAVVELDTIPVSEAPTLSTDELVIYYADRSAAGTNDIFVAERTSTTLPWGSPMPVSELESSADDEPSWLSIDRCRLYFASSRNGSFDMFLAERVP